MNSEIDFDLLIEQFEKQWQDSSACIEDYVSQLGDTPEANWLVALIEVDLEYRWRYSHQGREIEHCNIIPVRPSVQNYTSGLAVQLPTQALHELVQLEFTLRRRWQGDISVDEVLSTNQGILTEEQIDNLKSTLAKDSLQTVPEALEVGSEIGPYQIVRKLAEGGMGAVYLAEQLEPVKRQVALKIIKPNDDMDQIIARFEAERQALALMDHPNIARIFDGGTTLNGTPYFVMELVDGIPFTHYCDTNRLAIRERLELFIPICQAVQHAHKKGIIHRDLKPSNILVAKIDGRPVPKVIDFGLAKATDHALRLTDKTMFTEFGQVLGTLKYMSPEQTSILWE